MESEGRALSTGVFSRWWGARCCCLCSQSHPCMQALLPAPVNWSVVLRLAPSSVRDRGCSLPKHCRGWDGGCTGSRASLLPSAPDAPGAGRPNPRQVRNLQAGSPAVCTRLLPVHCRILAHSRCSAHNVPGKWAPMWQSGPFQGNHTQNDKYHAEFWGGEGPAPAVTPQPLCRLHLTHPHRHPGPPTRPAPLLTADVRKGQPGTSPLPGHPPSAIAVPSRGCWAHAEQTHITGHPN